MEPIRGLWFVNGSIAVLQKCSNAKVIIGGRNRCAYSYGPKDKSKGWKEVAISEYEEKGLIDRVKFTGLMNYGYYRDLLRRTDLHCYFTRPYVTN